MTSPPEFPQYITHYYRGRPFRTLTALSPSDRARVIDALDFPPEASHRFQSPYYFEQRLRYEALMYDQFIAKGGEPSRRHPHYAILGQSEIWERITEQSIRLPITDLHSTHVSFTYTDSWMTYVEREPDGELIPHKPQYDMLYRWEELPKLFQEHGWPGDRWKTEPEWENDIYVEAQIWSDEPLRDYRDDGVDP